MKRSVAAAILAALFAGATPALAADKAPAAPAVAPAASVSTAVANAPVRSAELQAMYKAVQADKKAYVKSQLNLTDAEAKKFWPIYDAYQRDLDMYNRRRSVALEGLIGLDKPVSDLYAKQLAKELIATDEGEIKARRKIQNKLIQINRMISPIPASKAARYLQLEAQIRAVQNYAIAEHFPLVK
ncbi:MAG: hypothetical protein ABI607_15340 [Betaproteobacteria bacterium]